MTAADKKLLTLYTRKTRKKEPVTSDEKRANALYQREHRNRNRENLEKSRLNSKRWKKKVRYKNIQDPIKSSARAKLNHALKTGLIMRFACLKCGEAETEAHHHDYSKPLDVEWLCRPCHAAAHRKYH